MEKKLSKSRALAARTIYESFKILKDAGGQLPGKEVIEKISERLHFNEWEAGIYEKTGYVRWKSILNFFTIDCIKSGFLQKQDGIWYLTPDGEEAMQYGEVELLKKANKGYYNWRAKNPGKEIPETEIDDEENDTKLQKATIDQLEEQAIEGIKNHLSKKNPYEFQDMIAALLRAMNYYTPFISPKGRDGGVDIIAYQDPLGTTAPRIKVQVKHRPDASINVEEIRSLMGLLNNDEVGLFVTSGRFTSEAERISRDSHIHVKLIDFENLISLWKQFYHKLLDEEKNMLPLQPIYFLGSNE